MQLWQDYCVLSVNIAPYAVGRCGRRSSCAAMGWRTATAPQIMVLQTQARTLKSRLLFSKT